MAKVKTEAEKAAVAEAKAAKAAEKKAAKEAQSVEIPLSKAGVMEFEDGSHPRTIRASKKAKGAE
jgi:hypothetical protein